MIAGGEGKLCQTVLLLLLLLLLLLQCRGLGVSGRIPVRVYPPFNLPKCNMEPPDALLQAVLR